MKAVGLVATTIDLLSEVERLNVTIPGQVWTDDAGWFPCEIVGTEPDDMCRIVVAGRMAWARKKFVRWHRAPLAPLLTVHPGTIARP